MRFATSVFSLALAASAAGADVPAENSYGACAHLTRGEPTTPTCDLIRQMGAGWVRCDFDGRVVERQPGVWDFACYDAIVAACEAAGLQLLPILYEPPKWSYPAYEHLDAWGDYVQRVVAHYGQRLPVLEIWNEPNINPFWKNPNPTNYLAVLRRAYEVVKAHDPSLRVALGGMAGVPLDFIEEIYRLGGARHFDIMNVHPYTNLREPESRADAWLEQLHALMAKYGDADKPLWITEMGWPTHRIHVNDAEILRAGLRVADPSKTAWRAVYVPAEPDGLDGAVRAVREALPAGSTVEACRAPKLAERLARGDVDAVIHPFTEDYPSDSLDAVEAFVKTGGVFVDFGGMPMFNAYRTDANGRACPDPKADSARDRARLRIQEVAWWMDARYPAGATVRPTDAMDGFCPTGQTYAASRFLTPARLRPGDAFIPLLAAQTNGVGLVAAAVYKFNSDYRGAVVVNARVEWASGASDEARQARMLARSLGLFFAEGVEKVFWYEFTSKEEDAHGVHSHYGIVHGSFAPKPAYGAYKTFIDRRPVGSVQRSDRWKSAGGRAYFPQWRRPDGKDAGMIWTIGPTGERWLAFTTDHVSFHDVTGLRLFPKRDGTRYLVPVTDSPVYFTGGALQDK